MGNNYSTPRPITTRLARVLNLHSHSAQNRSKTKADAHTARAQNTVATALGCKYQPMQALPAKPHAVASRASQSGQSSALRKHSPRTATVMPVDPFCSRLRREGCTQPQPTTSKLLRPSPIPPSRVTLLAIPEDPFATYGETKQKTWPVEYLR